MGCSLSKIIVKTILKTVLGLVAVLAVAFLIMSLGFPQTMAGICEKTGAYNLATGYASLRYAYTGSAEDLDRCAGDSILAGNDENIVKYCGSLVKEDEFTEICLKYEGNGDYRQYVYSKLAAAQYRTGDKEGALASAQEALEGVGGFPAGNAIAALATEVAEARDKDTASKLLAVIEKISPVGDEESVYYNRVKNILKIGE